jgi:hypothetical protein
VISIQDNPRFKKDCEKYNKAIKECSDEIIKSELKSLYDQFLKLVKQLDQSQIALISERVINNTQHTELKNNLANIRARLESKLSDFNSK